MIGGKGSGFNPTTASGAGAALGGNVSGTVFYIGYSYRSFLNKDWSWNYDLAPGNYQLIQGNNNSTGNPALFQSFNFDWTFGQSLIGSFGGTASIGIGIYDIWTGGPDNFLGAGYGGHDIGSYFRFKFGI